MGLYKPGGKVYVGKPPTTHHKSSFLGKVVHGVGKVSANAARDVLNIPVGLAETGKAVGLDLGSYAKHPLRGKQFKRTEKVLRQTAAGYKHTYGPLVHGDLGEFAHRVGEHPVGPVLDVAAIATGGVGAATKAGLLKPAARSFAVRSPAARVGQEGGRVAERAVVGTELSRRLKIGAQEAFNKLPPDFKVLGEVHRYGKALRREQRVGTTRLQLKVRPFQQAERAMSSRERIASNLMHDYPTRDLLEAYKAQMRASPDVNPGYLRLLDDPKVNALFDKPSPRMKAALTESENLGALMEDLLGIHPDTALQRRYQAALMARGAKFVEQPGKDLFGQPTTEHVLTAPEGTTLPRMIEEIRAETVAQGRPEPLYRKHVSIEERRGTKVASGGAAPPRSPIQRSAGVLTEMGRVAYDTDTLTPQWFRAVKWATYKDRHADLIRSGVEVPRGYRLAEGEEFLKRRPGERIGYTERTAGQFERQLPGEGEPSLGTEPELTTLSEAEAATTPRRTRIVVPANLRRQITGEYARSNAAARNLIERPLTVWRALVLNLRVGWLTNNVVGNSFLYAIKNAGPEGIRAWVRSVHDMWGDPAVRQLVDDPAVRSRLTPQDMAELLPDQVAGTFFGTQTPTEGAVAGTLNAAASPTRWLRTADIRYEQALRRAMANRLARKDPAIKARYDQMAVDAKNWRQAAKQELASNPQLTRQISAQINDALGDFFNLGPAERSILRNIAPFYAWYRAITIVLAKMPLDAPGRSLILQKMGELGREYEQDYGLSWLRGAVGLGGNTIISTQAANPYSTPVQVVEGATAAVQAGLGLPADRFAAQQGLGMLNPLIMAPAAGLAAAARGESGGGQLGLSGLVRGLPETRLAFPRGSKLYPGSPRRREALSYLGAPVKTVNPAEAARRAGKGSPKGTRAGGGLYSRGKSGVTVGRP